VDVVASVEYQVGDFAQDTLLLMHATRSLHAKQVRDNTGTSDAVPAILQFFEKAVGKRTNPQLHIQLIYEAKVTPEAKLTVGE
jgi:hypothetical protein